MENIFFLDANRQKVGPLKDSELLERGVNAATLVWMPGLQQWTPAGQVPQLAALFVRQEAAYSTVNENSRREAEQPVYQTERTVGEAQENGAEILNNPAVQQAIVNAAAQGRGVNVCGAIGLTLALLLFVAWIPGVGPALVWLVALIFSIIGVCRPQKGMAIAGLIITVVLLFVGIISMICGLKLLTLFA